MRRRMSFIHQKPQVFNSSVYDNVACGLRWRRERTDRIAEKVAHMLKLVGLQGYSGRNARTLSGGEAQRVALARALVLEPELLLLDEPTANLDPVSTAKIEQLIAHVARQRNTTMIMATHDMAQGQQLADRMGVLLDGRLAQTGNSTDIFRSPRNREVADFIGMENIVASTITTSSEGMVTASIAADPDGPGIQAVSDYPEGRKVYACIRPEDITLAPASHRSSARNSFQGTVSRVSSLGPLCRIELDCGFPLVALITRVSAEELALRTGSQVHAAFKATAVHIMDGGTDQ
jgi:tungstate transport system ATP-binding protein